MRRESILIFSLLVVLGLVSAGCIFFSLRVLEMTREIIEMNRAIGEMDQIIGEMVREMGFPNYSVYQNKTMVVTKTGIINQDETWSGTVRITGDLLIEGATVTIEPGTTVLFAANRDDQHAGGGHIADPMTRVDPSRTTEYTRSHVAIHVEGTLIAIGTPDRWIAFTSDSPVPTLADWDIMSFRGKGILKYCVVEWAHCGPAALSGSNVTITHSIIRHTLWGGLHASSSNPVYEHNILYDNGHEAFDLCESSATIRYNIVHSKSVCIYGHAEEPLIFEYNILRDSLLEAFSNPYAIIRNNIFICSGELMRSYVYKDYVVNPQEPARAGIGIIDNAEVEITNNMFIDSAIFYLPNDGTGGVFYHPERPPEPFEILGYPLRMAIKNNIFYNTDNRVSLGSTTSKNTEISYNIFYNIVNLPENLLGVENIFSDPLLTNDFKLKSGSPAKGAGEFGVDMGIIWNRKFELLVEIYFEMYPSE